MTRIRCIAPALRIASGVLLLVSTAAAQETSPLLSKKLSPAAEAAIRERVEAVHANFRQKHGRDPSYFGLVCCQILQIPAAAFESSSMPDRTEFRGQWVCSHVQPQGAVFGRPSSCRPARASSF